MPKSFALRFSERYALLIGRPLLALSWLMRPLVWFLTASSNLLLRFFGDRTTFTGSRLSPEELQQLVEEAAKAGSLDPRAGEIASRAFELGDIPLSAVMIPRNRIVALPRHSSAEKIREVLLERGHSRMPVYEGSLDNVVGYVIAKDLLGVAWEGKLLQREGPNVEVVRGTATLRELNRALGLELEEGQGYSTVGGLCAALAGSIPQRGTRLTLEDGTVLEVLDATPRKVRTVRIHLPPREEARP